MEAVVLQPVLGLLTVTLHACSAERIRQVCVGSEVWLLMNANQKSRPCVEAVWAKEQGIAVITINIRINNLEKKSCGFIFMSF
jgi:hypothetical protein